MDSGLLADIAFGIMCFVFSGSVTFSDKFTRWSFPEKHDWGKYQETKKYWSDEGVYRYNRYGLGPGTFIIGLAISREFTH
jgi:hypothetical protein